MDVKSRLLDNFLSTVEFNFWDCLTKPGEMDCRISPTSWIKFRPQVGAVPIIPIISGEDISAVIIELSMPPGVLPPTLVLLTCQGFMDVHTLSNAASAMIYFVAGVKSVCGVNLISAIPGFFDGGKTGMVRELNNFCSRFPLLV